MARKNTLQFPVGLENSFTGEERELLHRAMQAQDIQSLPPTLVRKAKAAFRQKDVTERMALPAHNWDVHTRSLRGLPSDLRQCQL